MIDIGANLTHESFQDDLNKVIDDAQSAGIEQLIVTGTCVESSQQALTLCQEHDGYLYSTAGIHPHDAKDFNDSSISSLRDIAQEPYVKALGEMGLDFNRDFSPRDKQEKCFCEQLQLATENQLPVFLHQRDAHERFYPILKEFRDHLNKGVVHCFTGTKEELYAYLDLDMYIGITGWICDERRGKELLSLVKSIPQERLMVETDSPYLLPRTIKPKPKSRRNVPANLRYVIETLSQCLEQNVDQLINQTKSNSRDFFAL